MQCAKMADQLLEIIYIFVPLSALTYWYANDEKVLVEIFLIKCIICLSVFRVYVVGRPETGWYCFILH